MHFHLSALATVVSFATLISAMPTHIHDSVVVTNGNNNAKRVPCPEAASLEAVKAKRTEDEDIEEDDSAGLIVACAF
ncbi:hypothetical protein F5X98DRAFT_29628 [Xylaria grammica]|nr:hypothetical protein F5X98DRAFT_29628 [Xylaria grammica]